nr:MAG: hypothetical protein [Chemarfal virus 166]
MRGALLSIAVGVLTTVVWDAFKASRDEPKFSGYPDEFAVAEQREILGEDARVVDDAHGVADGDDGTDEVMVRGVAKRRVSRNPDRMPRFIRKWVDWGKTEFPSAWRQRRQLDVECIMRALCRKMREEDVRDADIARYKDRILLGIMMPSDTEIETQRMLATEAGGQWQRAGDGWQVGNTRGILGWLFGKKRGASFGPA